MALREPGRAPGPINLNRYALEFAWQGIPTYMKLPVCLTPEDLRAGAIDVAAERQRISKDITKTEKERAGVAARLNNPSFKERAPADIIEKTQKDFADIEERLAKLQGSLERLKSL